MIGDSSEAQCVGEADIQSLLTIYLLFREGKMHRPVFYAHFSKKSSTFRVTME